MSYGKRVIGEEAWQEQLAADKVATEQSGFGPRVTGDQPEAPVAVEEPPAEKVPPMGQPVPTGEEVPTDEAPRGGAETTETRQDETEPSVDDIVQALEGRTSMQKLDTLIDAEFDRDDGPRKDALLLLLDAEKGRREPRAAILEQLNTAIKL